MNRVSQRILIAEGDATFSHVLFRLLGLDGHVVFQAFSIARSKSILQKQAFDVLLLSDQLPDGSGVCFVEEMKKNYPQITIVMISSVRDLRTFVTTMKNGTEDYIIKGDNMESLREGLRGPMRPFDDRFAAGTSSRRPLVSHEGFTHIIGATDPMLEAIHVAKRLASTDASVLITGESGTGKEMLARAIHQEGSRSQQPFFYIDCSSQGEDFPAPQMFAGSMRGTAFFSEVGELSAAQQSRLCGLLESSVQEIDALPLRVIASSSRNLALETLNGNFRDDLLYRCNAFSIHLAPLRERTQDIPLLTDYYAQFFSHKLGKKISGISQTCERALLGYGWPYNVRELKNIVERAVMFSEGTVMSENALPFELVTTNHVDKGKSAPYDLNFCERLHIRKVLELSGWNKPEAARLMNISLSTLYRKIEEFSLLPGQIH